MNMAMNPQQVARLIEGREQASKRTGYLPIWEGDLNDAERAALRKYDEDQAKAKEAKGDGRPEIALASPKPDATKRSQPRPKPAAPIAKPIKPAPEPRADGLDDDPPPEGYEPLLLPGSPHTRPIWKRITRSLDKSAAFTEAASKTKYLVGSGQLTKQDAADFLQEAAEAFSVIDDIGQDAVQSIISKIGEAKDRAQVDDAIDQIPTAISTTTTSTRKPDFTPILLDDIQVENDPAGLVESLLPVGPGFGIVAGAPKSLKSFFLMDLGLHIAAEIAYLGRKVQPGAVVYITSEGVRGAKRRLVAMRRQLGIEGKNVPFFLIPVMPNLGTGTADRDALIAAIEAVVKRLKIPLVLVIIDTMRRATPAKDENSAKDMGAYIDNKDAIARHFGCLVLSAHHSPRSEPSRGSGTNAIDGAADVILAVERQGDSNRSIVTLARMKDGEDGFAWSVELVPLPIGTDRNGVPIIACAVDATALTAEQAAKPKHVPVTRMSKADRIALRALDEAIAECGEPAPASNHIPPNVRVTTVDRWRDYAYRRSISAGEERARQRAFKRAAENLAGSNLVGIWGEHVWAV
jgi:RecA-family ATPase